MTQYKKHTDHSLINKKIDLFINYNMLESAFQEQNLTEKKQRRLKRKLRKQTKINVSMLDTEGPVEDE